MTVVGVLSERLLVFVLAAVQFTHMMDFVILMPIGPEHMRVLRIGPAEGNAVSSVESAPDGMIR